MFLRAHTRKKRYCRLIDYPELNAVATWEELAKYSWLAPRMKLPSPRCLEAALDALQQFRPAKKQSASL